MQNAMSLREDYLTKIDAIPVGSFNREQKIIARKIIENTAEADLSAVYGLIAQRVKTGFVFDEAPEVNHNAVALTVERPKLNIGVDEMGMVDGEPLIEHKLIIGENYDALKNLCATYINRNGKGMIDIIYIDPPYNTDAAKGDGNDYKDAVEASKFVYRDKFTRNGWLNMMNERLKLAKRLLTDNGMIFISIDDSEQAYLKVLCDEVFGEENFVATFLWNKTETPPSLSHKVRKTHEYVLCYQKHKNNAPMIARFVNGGDAPLYNEINAAGILEFPANYVETNLPDGTYCKGVRDKIELMDDVVVASGKIATRFKLKGNFRWQQSTLDEEINNKVRLIVRSEKFAIRYCRPGDRIVKPTNEISKKDNVGTNETASAELKQLFSESKEKVFDFNKPTSLIYYLLHLVSHVGNKNEVVLDFFAGSGTTGQAVMELNADDGGRRQFILVTNNEGKDGVNIGDDIARERLYRVICGKGSKGENIGWSHTTEKPYLGGNSVRVFGVEKYVLTIDDLDTAERLKKQACVELRKLNPKWKAQDDIDIYNELSALNPYDETVVEGLTNNEERTLCN